MSESPEYVPGSAMQRIISSELADTSQPQPEQQLSQERNPDKEAAALESLSQAGKDIVEQSGGDTEVVEILHLLGNELDVIANYGAGPNYNTGSKRELLKRALRAAVVAAKAEIGRG
jgi:hypothetical protein